MNPMSNLLAVVPDANVLIGLCARETDKYQTAKTAFGDYIKKGYEFFAPNVIVGEVVFVLCQKFADGSLTQLEYEAAVNELKNYLGFIELTPNGETSLIKRAVEIRDGYGCSRSSDAFYIALAEELAKTYDTELLTFDKGFVNQAAKNAPTVKINLLPI